jgi:single-stranded-DNA-specific exonuclease
MPNPDGLIGIEDMIEKISAANFVGIFGDYDVDGITSTVMWKKFLDEIGIKNCIYIPSRQDGYGASEIGIQALLQQGVDLILFLDCGSASKDLIESIPVTVCILDHHQVQSGPNATIVNPHLSNIPHEAIYKTLCTAGLSFLVLAKFARKVDKIQSCLSLLDLCAIGTLGDMMDLNSFNRALIKRGLQLINSGSNLGLTSLINELNLRQPITASDLAFYIIPALNAAGRISKADSSFNLLLSKDMSECAELSKILKALNARRKEIEEEVIQQAVISVDQTQKLLILKSPNWHPGIVGIIASRVKEMYSKTSFVLYKNSGLWKGSARSHNCNIGQLIQQSVTHGFALQGGGHAAAGGITICETRFDDWANWMQMNIPQDECLIETVLADAEIEECLLGQITRLKDFGPFGNGNSAPKIILKNVWLRDVFVQKNYLKCTLTSGMSFVGFRFNTDFINLLQGARGRYVDILLSIDESGGAKIDDVRMAVDIRVVN